MLTSLRSRLLVSYLLVTGLVLSLIALSLLFFASRDPFASRQVYRQLDALASLVTTRLEGTRGITQPEQVVKAVGRFDQLRALNGRVIILGAGGKRLADSQPESSWPGDASPRNLFGAAPQQGKIQFTPGASWLYISRPLADGLVLVLAATEPSVGTVASQASDLLAPLLQTCLVGLVVSALLAWMMARGVAGPLRRMADAAVAVARGDLSARLRPSGPNEVRQLAETFNDMVERVQSGQQAQRDFVANVSHELKTPLTSIEGFAQALLDGTAGDEPRRKQAANIILEESLRLTRLVDDLLDLARFDAGELAFDRSPVDLAAVLRGVVERMSLRAAEQRIPLQLTLEPLPTVLGDGDRLAQVFTNLVDNALKHSPPNRPIQLHGELSRGWVGVHVEDHGPGIPPEELSRIFERFYQLDKARPGGEGRGAGLGLAISREIVQAHGGRLTAVSRVGEGSRFTVWLPAAESEIPTLARSRRRPS